MARRALTLIGLLALACGGESSTGRTTGESSGSETAADDGDGGSGDSAEGDGETTTGIEFCPDPAGSLTIPTEGEFVPQSGSTDAQRDWCTGAMHATAGAIGSTLRVSLPRWDGVGGARVRIDDLLGNAMVDWTPMAAGGTLDVTLAQSGEVLVRVEPQDLEEPSNDYGIAVECISGCDLEFTRYPVLMMHGMAGTETYINVLDYWFRLPDLIDPTGFLMIIRDVDAFNGSTQRSVQWLAHLDDLTATGVGRKFNLIAHSQGGIDARLVISTLDTQSRVASLLTVATPHRGTAVADVAIGAFTGFNVPPATVNGIMNVLGGLLGLGGGDLVAQMQEMSTDAMTQFNLDVLDDPAVYYSSWSGKSCSALDFLCQAGNSGEIVDPLFSIPFEFMKLAEGDNDGVTGVESCKWGEWMGTVPADHMDEVGQIADVFNLSFDHREFYLQEIRRLAALGY